MEPKHGFKPTQVDRNRERLHNHREHMQQKREQQIDNMSPSEILNELKSRGLAVFGTNREKIDRLKKANGISAPSEVPAKRGNVINNIEEISKRREERRKKMEEEKHAKKVLKAENKAQGKNVDVVFQNMVDNFKAQIPPKKPHTSSSDLNICVCVRKRPIFTSENINGEIDAVSCSNPQVMVHEPKLKVDGITKYLENHTYTFDNAFGEGDSNDTIYRAVLQPVCPFIVRGGTLTCFAYGQTGSGKTFTMKGLQEMVVSDLFKHCKGGVFGVSFYEIYGGRCFDLLNNRAKLSILEDGGGNIQVQGLREHSASEATQVLKLIEYGNSVRSTYSTTSNEDSSRSHAICQIRIGNGTLRLVDLAGSERAQDTMSNNRQRRIEGAEINKSLLALKECINALRRGPDAHVPYRGSKLTLVLRDSFEGGAERKVIMITCVSPGHGSSDHTLNSLRYSDRLKEQSAGNVVKPFQPPKKQQFKENVEKKPQKKIVEEKFQKSFKDMKYIQKNAVEEKISKDMLHLHKKVETILEEEEELLEMHVDAIKQDAKILTEEGELIALAQGEGNGDYDVDTYVSKLEKLTNQKVNLYQNLYKKLLVFKRQLNEEEQVSNHLSQHLGRRG